MGKQDKTNLSVAGFLRFAHIEMVLTGFQGIGNKVEVARVSAARAASLVATEKRGQNLCSQSTMQHGVQGGVNFLVAHTHMAGCKSERVAGLLVRVCSSQRLQHPASQNLVTDHAIWAAGDAGRALGVLSSALVGAGVQR